MAWVNVKDSNNYGAITDATFNYTWQNHGGGWYWVNSSPNTWLYCSATDRNEAWQWTDAYSTIYFYLTPRGK